MRCVSCGADNREGRKFCSKCGAALARACANCGALSEPGDDFCGDCGTSLTPSSAAHTEPANVTEPAIRIPLDASSAALDGERKTVTALFADLKGSTELMEDLDPEEARAIIDPALRIMVEAVRRYEGYVVQSTGDGIFALFGAPVAHEDHPQRALYAALQMQQELREHGQRRAPEGRAALEARVGVNTGEVVVRSVEIGGKVEYTPIGHTANLASRLQTMAPIGSIAVSEHTRNLCEGYFELRALGPMAARGISEALNVYEVTGLGSLRTHFERSARRGLTPFVGRKRELEQMCGALELAISGHGQIVSVMAEAGTGKSRLFYQFKATIPPTCKLLEAYSVSHGRASAWLPVLELLRGYFDVRDTDDVASRRGKVLAALGALDPGLTETLPYLYALLGIQVTPDPIAQMDPQIKRQRTLDAVKLIVVRESLKQPVVVIFEDLHWIDAQTQTLLDLLVDGVANSRVLLLFNYRPEYRHEWTNKSYYSQLRLDPLGGSEGTAMLTALLGESVELNPLKRLIPERTGGNPFFIEEIVQALFDEGALVRNGVVKVARPLTQVRLPATVQGILAARIDRQPSEHKQLLQTLAVMGKEVGLDLLRQVVPTVETQLHRMLADLQAGEFIYEQPAFPNAEYVFKHALTQEVAYNSLLIERRKLLHERTGQALESMFSDRLDDHVSELARHYSSSDNVIKAVEYLGRAGQQALQRCAPADATSHLTAAIRLLEKLPDDAERIQRELPLQMSLGQACILLKGWSAPEVERAFTRALEICERRGNARENFFALYGLYLVYHVRAAYRAARERAQQLLRLAQSAADPTLLVLAHYAVGGTSLHTGELRLAREHQQIAISIYDQERDRQLALMGVDAKEGCLSYAGWTLWHLGYPDEALATCKEAVAFARDISHPNSVASAEFFLNIVNVLRRDASAAEKGADRVIAFSTEHGVGAAWLAFVAVHLGWALIEQGAKQEEIRRIQEGIATAHAAGADIGRGHLLCYLAEACMKADRLDDALSAATEALAAADRQEERYYEPDIHRVRGEVLLRQDGSNVEEAENCFRRAIAIARKQSGKSLELRATTSLARLLAKQGRRDEAHAMLAVIYNWFTEGFDTADLKDAKALLDELAG